MDWSWLTGGNKRQQRLRGSERFQACGLSCHLGTLCDLSATGARIRFAGAPTVAKGDSVQLTITTDSQSVRVAASVAWLRRSMKGGELGIRFMNIRPGVQAALEQLAKYGCISTDASETSTQPSAGPSTNEPRSAAPPPTVQAHVEVEDLYALLGVEQSANEDDIRGAYRKLALSLHPDVCKEPGAAERFTHISKAYSVLRSAEHRAKYNLLLARSRAA